MLLWRDLLSAEMRRFLRFVAVGVANTAIGVVLFSAAYAVHPEHVSAALISAVISILLGFVLTGTQVFGFLTGRSLVLYVLWYTALAVLYAAVIDAGVRVGLRPF